LIDIHHHILPGLDDGPADREQALAMCRSAAANGITTIVATPHMLDGVYRVTADQVRRGVEALNRLLLERWTDRKEQTERPSTSKLSPPPPPPVILPGADVHLHEDLVAKVKRGDVLTINDTGAYLLLELPPTVMLSRLGRFLADMLAAGVRPILTHPERHPRIAEEDGELEGWARGGGLVQVTAGAYLGRFGRTAQEAAERWARAGLVHVIATDAHPLPGREPLLREAAERLQAVAGAEAAGRIVKGNPERIIRGEAI
jgi:protein-tyrosine phosphatase